jgi:hypothetical protein
MVYARCIDCGDRFYREARETWKVRCLPCWRANKGQDLRAELESLQSTIWVLEYQNENLRQRLEELKEHLRFLIFASHPDRNPGKENEAHEAMITLLNLRDEMPRLN